MKEKIILVLSVVLIFTLISGIWSVSARISLPNLFNELNGLGSSTESNWGKSLESFFGNSVALAGDNLIVGANFEDGGQGDPLGDTGSTYVFERNQGGSAVAQEWHRDAGQGNGSSDPAQVDKGRVEIEDDALDHNRRQESTLGKCRGAIIPSST